MDWLFCSQSKTKTRATFFFFFFFFFFCFLCLRITNAAFNLTAISFEDGYSPLFGDGNLVRSPDGRNVRLLLDRFSGSGFVSSKMYNHGFFSAMIKLPSDYTAGICVAFYTSNADVFEKTHDELDFEFLGNIAGKPWRFQTNFYGNGSTHHGREERYRLWFDPSKEFHRYSILWTDKNIIFFVDEVPIREVVRTKAMGSEFPTKPMSLYTTIWDASQWATSGGKAKVNYRYAPFTAEFKQLTLDGCPVDTIDQFPSSHCHHTDSRLAGVDFAITPARRRAMRKFREHFMYYSYCYDTIRYPVPPPECVIIPSEQRRFRNSGRLRFGGSHKSHKRRQRLRNQVPLLTGSDDPDM